MTETRLPRRPFITNPEAEGKLENQTEDVSKNRKSRKGESGLISDKAERGRKLEGSYYKEITIRRRKRRRCR